MVTGKLQYVCMRVVFCHVGTMQESLCNLGMAGAAEGFSFVLLCYNEKSGMAD